MRSPRRTVVEVVGVSLAVAVPAGIAWSALAPEVVLRVDTAGSPRLTSAGAAQLFGVDAWFLLVGAVVGLVLGGALFLRHRARPVLLVAVLATAGLAGSLLAWRVGEWAGPSPAEARARGLEEGASLLRELDLAAYGVLLAWPIAAVVAVLVTNALLDDRTPVGRPAVTTAPERPVSSDERSAPSWPS